MKGAGAENLNLSTVADLLVSPQSSKPVNALVQDALCTINLFTKRSTFLRREKVMQLLMSTKEMVTTTLPTPAILKPVLMWTGKQIISLFLPDKDLHGYHSARLDSEKGLDTPSDSLVTISEGTLLTGILCKKTVGTDPSGIIHIIWRDFGPKRAERFIDDVSQMLNHWMLHRGFSVGIGDGMLEGDALKTVAITLEEKMAQVDDLIAKYKRNELWAEGTLSLQDTMEGKVQSSSSTPGMKRAT
ncbi:DNA-directed RNA polymerase II subunit rpb1 [Rhizophlyctis rosea]|nr:DNA-directed RNA polymerase II subunit rpb1 [Rhizophlyctis rosea]